MRDRKLYGDKINNRTSPTYSFSPETGLTLAYNREELANRAHSLYMDFSELILELPRVEKKGKKARE